MALLDIATTYKFIKLMSSTFNKWDIYKDGLIDEKGKIIDKSKKIPMFDNVIRRLKIILNKFIGSSKVASVMATLYFLKEDREINLVLREISKMDGKFKRYVDIPLKEQLVLMLSEGEVLKKGKYKILEDDPDDDFRKGDIVEIPTDLKPKKVVAGVSLFEIKLGTKKIVVVKDILKKVG